MNQWMSETRYADSLWTYLQNHMDDAYKLTNTNMANEQIFEGVSDKFNVAAVCVSEKQKQEPITKLYK